MNWKICLFFVSILAHGLGKPSDKYFASNKFVDEYIVNGNDVEKGTYPWMLSLEVEDPEFRHTCGASLLDERHALTAAHCLDGRQEMNFRVVYGASHRGDDETPSDREGEVNIAASILHEDYDCATCDGAYPNDVAVMYLEEPIELNEFVQGAQLADPSIDYVGLNCRSSGWGKLSGEVDDVPVKLQDIDISVLTQEDCLANMPAGSQGSVVEDVHVCIFDTRDVSEDEKRGICQGDSGGPVQCEVEEGTWHVLGAASWVIGGISTTCRPEFPGVYAKGVSYLDWIQGKIDDPSWKPDE